VLTVGAGLTGLTAAMELSRLGIPVRLIDKLPGPSARPRTLVVRPLTAELLEQRGISPETLPAGKRVTHAAVYRRDGLLGTVELSTVELAPDRDHRGHVLLACQAEVERVLREQLARQDVAVEYGTELIALVQAERARSRPGEPGGPGVRARLRHPDGRLEDVAASYLISADGMQGTTGRLLKLPARGQPDGRSYVLADLRLDGDLGGDVISVFLGQGGFVMLLPAGGGRFQCVAAGPPARSGDHGGPVRPELEQLIDGCLPAAARLRELRWSSWFRAARRPSPPLRHGRVFFGGDSAYAYSPATAQGANSGIQDMVNLGWKLAMVLQEKAAPELLGTYAGERLQAIDQLERQAEGPAQLLGPSSVRGRGLVTRIGPALPVSSLCPDLCTDLAGEVIPDYWSSPLSAPPRGAGHLQPGGCVPDLRVFAADLGAPAASEPRAVRLHELLSPSRLNLLLTDESGSAAASSAWPERLQPWQALLAAHLVTPVPGQEEQLRFVRAFGGGQSLILVRPDAYACFAGGQKDLPRLVSWLSTWFPPMSGASRPARRRQLAVRQLRGGRTRPRP
jgi:2-polyprenyl-6-methoxyphenol hydroxylase-like FAD-dependent oxidoreductase